MSIRALHYITGDTPQSGFRRIGSSYAFPADQLPWLNNGDSIQERSRIERSSNRPGGGGIQQLSHVWEYQTGKFGTPVVINSAVAIGTGRAHAYSEYILAQTDRAAEEADAGDLIRGTDQLRMLNVDTFMKIPGREEIECAEESWVPRTGTTEKKTVSDELWRLTLLSRYWQQASIRAFSSNTPETVRVNLGEYSEDLKEETEETIRQAKAFFADVVCPGLPKQVQNIASMAAGVNSADTMNLYTALEFDISLNMFEEETMLLRRPRELKKYRLNEAEREFMQRVSQGEVPKEVQQLFDNYVQLSQNRDATELNTPFMADYRVWYTIYCMEGIITGKHAFIEKAGLMNEPANPKKIRDARACFLILRTMRNLLEGDHRLNENRRSLVSEMLAPWEEKLLQIMREDMESENAERFMLFGKEIIEYYRRYLYSTPENQQLMTRELMVLDQQVSDNPLFLRACPAIPLRNETADRLNSELLKELLHKVIRPLIDQEKKREKIENKYLLLLKSEDFRKWALQPQNEQTQSVFADFFQEEIQDSGKHFLLYGITLYYLPRNELLLKTLEHFTRERTAPGQKPTEREIKVAAHGANDFISGNGRTDPACVSAMNRYYLACFREYRERIVDLRKDKDIVGELGGDTTEAIRLILEEASTGKRLTVGEVKAVFQTFGGTNGEYVRREQIRDAFTGMVVAQLDQALSRNDNSVVDWISGMIGATNGLLPFDTTESLVKIFEAGKTGEQIKPSEISAAFDVMGKQADSLDTSVRRAFSEMLAVRRDAARKNADDPDAFGWQCEVLNRCPWKDIPEWMTEQRTENVILLCDQSMNSGKPVDASNLATAQHWLEENAIQKRGKVRLNQLCEFWMEKGETLPAEKLLPCFDEIDESCPNLSNFVFQRVVEHFTKELNNPEINFGELIQNCSRETEKAGKRLDNLYTEAEAQVEIWLSQHFANTGDLGYLISDQDRIPENTEFYRVWQNHLSDQIYHQQVELFNRQQNLEKMQTLRTDILKRSRNTHPALQAAYQVIDGYEERLSRLFESSEYDAVTQMGQMLKDMNSMLERTSDVRKTLCTALRNETFPVQKTISGKSFRHELCVLVLRAVLTDTGENRRGGVKGCPDWNMVLNSLFSRAELDEAAKKPFHPDHIRVLQRLLSLVENVKLMREYGMDARWLEELIRAIREHSDLHKYQNALARNRKMCEKYQLQTDQEGLVF